MKEKVKILIPGIGLFYCLFVIAIGLSNNSKEYRDYMNESDFTNIESNQISDIELIALGQDKFLLPESQNVKQLEDFQCLVNSIENYDLGLYRP